MTTLAFSVACESCGYVLPPLSEISEAFFQHGADQCKNCGATVDLWQAYLNGMRGGITPLDLAGFGARITVASFRLELHERFELKLTEFGVPDDAVILALNFGVSGAVFPIELHGENSRRRWPGTTIWLYGTALPGTPSDARAESLVLASAVWMREAEDVEAWLMMSDALEAAAAERWVRCLPPAQSAYEIIAATAVTRWLARHASKEVLKQYVEREMTSFAVTNIWLQEIARAVAAPLLSDDIRGRLNRLRALRNKIVHEGRTEAQLSATEARELLVAAAFGFEYVRLLRRRVAG